MTANQRIQLAVRVGGGAAFLTAFIVLFTVHAGCTGRTGSTCPSYSFNAPWILRTERALIVLVVLLFVLVVFVKTVIQGELPEITTTGLKYRKESAKGIKELEAVVTRNATEAGRITTRIAEIFSVFNNRLKRVEDAIKVIPDGQLSMDLKPDGGQSQEVQSEL